MENMSRGDRVPLEWREMAWNGIAFPVPADWDMSGYKFRRRVECLMLEDPAAVRAQVEWTPTRETGCSVLADAYSKWGGKAVDVAAHREPLDGLPPAWQASRYRMKDGRNFLLALGRDNRFPFHVLIRLYGVEGEDGENLADVLRTMVGGVRFFTETDVPWRVFDLAIRVPSCFALEETSFLAGRKLMVFQNRLRRLWVWRLSLINRLLREKPAAEVLADLLNGQKKLAGVRFKVHPSGEVRAVRRPNHPLGHIEEIGRWCFRYQVDYRVDPEGNALMAHVFQYRRESDLDWIRGVRLMDDSPLR